MTREERLTAKITGFIITSIVEILLVLGLFLAVRAFSGSLSAADRDILMFAAGMVFMCLSDFIDNTRKPVEKEEEQ